jgi:hypothetical protein
MCKETKCNDPSTVFVQFVYVLTKKLNNFIIFDFSIFIQTNNFDFIRNFKLQLIDIY